MLIFVVINQYKNDYTFILFIMYKHKSSNDMRNKIQKIVVQAVAGTKDITKAIDELLLLCNVSESFPTELEIIEAKNNWLKKYGKSYTS